MFDEGDHICSVRVVFDEGSLHPMNGTVHLADYKEYAVTKVGTVTLEMHDETHCILTGVQYILSLKKNLIYVRSLELQGWLIASRWSYASYLQRASNYEKYQD